MIMVAFQQQLTAATGPNRVRALKRQRQRDLEGIPAGKRRYTGYNHHRALRDV